MLSTLRLLRDDDYAFVYRTIEVTMRGYVEEAFGNWDEAAQNDNIRQRMQSSAHRILQVDGIDTGVVAIERHPDHIALDSLFILPKMQKRGLGRSLLHSLQAEARTSGLPLRLRVLACNPARLWYRREGFRTTQVTPERWYMEYSG